MKYIFRAIWYYPMLLTICLIVELIYGLLILLDIIFKNTIVPTEEIDTFKSYPSFFLTKYYFKYIREGLDWEYIFGFKQNNTGA